MEGGSAADLEKKDREEKRRTKQKEIHLAKCKKDWFDHYDENKNGLLEKSELRKYVDDTCAKNNRPKFDDDFFDQLYGNCDKDKSGAIDFDEFMKSFGAFLPE